MVLLLLLATGNEFFQRQVLALSLVPIGLELDLDDMVIVPVATGMRIFDLGSLYRIMIEVRAHSDLESTKERVLALLAERHGEDDVTAITQDAVVGSLNQILIALTLAVAGIGAVSLAVAGLGVMNLMLVSVSERTAEVGLLKAVGATNRQVQRVFLAEAVLLSLSGALVGLGLGWGLVRGFVALYPAFPAAPRAHAKRIQPRGFPFSSWPPNARSPRIRNHREERMEGLRCGPDSGVPFPARAC